MDAAKPTPIKEQEAEGLAVTVLCGKHFLRHRVKHSLRLAALQKITQFLPRLPTEKSAARPAPSAFWPDHQQCNGCRNDKLRVAAYPSGAFDGAVCSGKDWHQSCCITTKLGTQALAGNLKPLLL